MKRRLADVCGIAALLIVAAALGLYVSRFMGY